MQDSSNVLPAESEHLAVTAESQLRVLFDLMPQLGWTARPDGFIEFYNRRWYEYTGRTYEEMQGWGWRTVHDPTLLPVVTERWRRSLETGEPFEMEFPLRRADGVYRWFLTRVQPVRDASGALVRWIGINTDIHERRLTSFASEEILRLFIASNVDYAIFMLDTGGHVQTWNAGAERIKGYRADEIIGKHFSTFYPPEVVGSGAVARELVVAAEVGRFEEEGYRVRKDGTRFWANVVISAVRDAEGTLIGFSKVTRDLTERRKSEQERQRLVRAEEAIRVRDEFLSIASHELKTPLTSLQLVSSGIRRGLDKTGAIDPEKLLARVATFDAQLRRMTTLINDLLDVNRMVGGQLEVRLEEVDIEAVVREVAERLQPDLAAAKCELVLHFEGPVRGRWDKLRLERIVANLLANALRYGRGGGIEIAVTSPGPTAVLSVRDHGIGIAEADQERIFDRFTRGATSESLGGLGLGLWIVKQFTESMAGTVAVQSELGKGSCLTVTLPLLPRAAAVAATTKKDVLVLVVEDDEDIREMLADLLDQEGYSVITATNGRDALEKVRGLAPRRPAVAFLDLMMPVMTGAELCLELQRDPDLNGMPVCLLSASGGLKKRADELGVDYLTKPVSIEQIVDCVERHAPKLSGSLI
jgi:PAS domain S-box-containing protein